MATFTVPDDSSVTFDIEWLYNGRWLPSGAARFVLLTSAAVALDVLRATDAELGASVEYRIVRVIRHAVDAASTSSVSL